jgi:UDP-N-acetylmuramoyl-L-alanyl-D-glutamate--2,6-diaminopimelate ligase
MKLDELVAGADATVEHTAGGALPEISGLTADSREVAPGFLFAALPGARTDGARFIADAVARGAAALVLGHGVEAATTAAPIVRVADPWGFLARAAARFHGVQPETMVAVTGTAGKTSVASFTRQIWSHSGFLAAMIGTTGVISPKRNVYGSLTTPDPVALHRLLAELAEEGVTHASMEASSHGLDQRRLDGVRLAAGAFTNLGRDHMDYHTDLEDYLAAKLRLFDTLLPKGGPAIVFSDDPWSGRVEDAARAAGLDVRTVGRRGGFLTLKRVEHQRQSQLAEIHHGGHIFEVSLPLAGDFQLFNALCAAGLAISTGVPAAKAMKALEQLEGASGRLELVGATEEGAPAYVDYAHKPDALKNVLESVRPFTTARIVVVFGCGGDRDRGKRPIMGEIAEKLADVVIVTDDNPRSEEPGSIRAEIMAAATGAIEIADRGEAIREAVAMLRPGDTLIVAGKGHEEGQIIGDRTLPFSDHEQIRAALAARRS